MAKGSKSTAPSKRAPDAMAALRKELEGLRRQLRQMEISESELARAEDALRRSEARYQTLTETAPVGIFHADLQGRTLSINYLNERGSQIIGLSAQEAHGVGWTRALHPDDRARVSAEWEQALGQRRPFQSLYRFRRADGGGTWVLAQVVAERNPEGQVVGYVGTLTDITERKRAEERLQQTNALLKAEQETSASGILIVDRDGNVAGFNTQFLRLWNIPEEMVQTPKADSVLLDYVKDQIADWDEFISLVRYLYDHPEEERLEVRIELNDGRILSRNTKPIRLPDGTPAGRVWDFTDRTDQVRAEMLLRGVARATDRLLTVRDQQQAFEEVLAILGEASRADRVYLFEHHAYPETGEDVVSQRHEWCRAGIEPQLGNPLLQNISHKTLDQIPWHEALLQGRPVGGPAGEFPVPMRAFLEAQDVRSLLLVPIPVGEDYWGFIGFDDCHSERIWSENTESLLVAMAASIGSAIGRRQTEGALRESEAKYRTLFESGSDAVMLFSGEAFLDCNEVTLRLFGCASRQQLLSLHPGADLSPPRQRDGRDSRQAAEEEIAKALREGFNHFEWLHQSLDGRIFPADVTLNSLKLGGRQVVQGVVRDLTERERAEQERLGLERKMLDAQKLESLGVLAGGIAHDFNNLLMSMLGNASLALRELSPESPGRELLERIETAARRAGELTRQLLAYSGKGRFLVEPVQINQLIEEMTHLLRVSISKKATLRYDLAGKLPLVEGDATQLRQVMMNLIVNASESLGEEMGTIAIATGTLHANVQYLTDAFGAPELPKGEYAYLEVSDTGCGMDAETRTRIFDPFFSTKFTGRGLGLAAVLGIVRGHGGALKVYSEPGEGTSIKILLPTAQDAKLRPQPAPNAEAPWQGSGTVLVIDDEEGVRLTAADMLKKLGFGVLLAGDGRAGIELFRAHADRIRCVLLDMTMPELSGPDTFRALKEIAPEVRVVLISGYNEQDTVSHFRGEGLAGFLQKPFALSQLTQKMRETLPTETQP